MTIASDQQPDDIESIHDRTAIYTASPEIDQLLDEVRWPSCGGRLLDPGCGDGNILVRALERLAPGPGDVGQARRVTGMDFHAPSVVIARGRCAGVLRSLGWTGDQAIRTATDMVECRDYLLDGRVHGGFDVVMANPPYHRRTGLPPAYRRRFDETVPPHARADLLHAYIDRMIMDVSEQGVLAMVTSDRWLVNRNAAELRRLVGDRLRVSTVRRLDTRSAFHRPKERAKDTPPRVHAVSMTLTATGRAIGAEPFRITPAQEVVGEALSDLVDLRLAPWLGPDGIFTVAGDSGLPASHLVPCIEPRDVDMATGTIGPTRRWAIRTGDEPPPQTVLHHLEGAMHAMPARGRRKVSWMPPERFDRHLPLPCDAVMVPRIALRLTGIRIPAGHLPTNHSLVIASGMPVERIMEILEDPRVQAQADAIALMVEGGYRSYTASLLREIVVPHDLIPAGLDQAA